MANLVKKLGFWSIVLYGINSIIGTGIFLTPGGVIKVAGTYAPISYLIAAVFATAAKYVKKNGAGLNCTKNVRHKTNIGGAFFYEQIYI